MKYYIKIVVAGAIGFAAIVGGLQVNRFLERRQAAADFVALEPQANIVNAQATPGSYPDFTRPVQRISQAVVSVDKLEQVFDFFGDSRGIQQTGTGSGVIVSAEGHIVTNNHVVSGADQVQVRLSDNRTVQAKVVGFDPRSDIAVIKVDGIALKPAILGDSSKLKPGEWVIAVGNPLGYSNTVSVGVVSSLNRFMQTGRESLLIDGIQTDAAINQGNSGGALTNANGELIGINTAIATTTGGSIGLGFAIPINRVKRVVADILKFGRMRYGELGVELLEISRDWPGAIRSPRVRRSIAGYAGAEPPTTGLIVGDVRPNSAATKLGLQAADVLLEIDNNKLNLPVDYLKALFDKRPGDKVRLKYWSRGQTKTTDATLQE